jgi:hypothetical protein
MVDFRPFYPDAGATIRFVTTPEFPKFTPLDPGKMRESAFRFRYAAEQLTQAARDWGKQLSDALDADLAKMREARKAEKNRRAQERAQFEADYQQWRTDNNLS